MAHYCPNCGRKLEDNEACSCQKNGASEQTVATVEMPISGEMHQQQAAGFGRAVKEVLHYTGRMFIKPAEALGQAAKEMSAAACLVYTVLFSLSIVMVLDACYYKVNSVVRSAYYYLGGEKPGVGTYFLGILYGILMGVCLLALTTVVMFITAKLFRSKVSLKESLHMTFALSAYPTIGLLLAFILVWFSLSGAIIAISVSIMLWIVNYGVGVRTQCKMNENSMQVMIYTIMLSVLLAAGAIVISRVSGAVMGAGLTSSFSSLFEFM